MKSILCVVVVSVAFLICEKAGAQDPTYEHYQEILANNPFPSGIIEHHQWLYNAFNVAFQQYNTQLNTLVQQFQNWYGMPPGAVCGWNPELPECQLFLALSQAAQFFYMAMMEQYAILVNWPST